MLTAFGQREFVEKAREAGAMAYLVKPFTKTDLVPAIEIAISRFAELAALEREVDLAAEQLDTRKLVDRAKTSSCRATPQRARRVPLDPAHRDGPPHRHAHRRAPRHRHARARSHGS